MALLIGAAAFVVFLISPVRQMSDSAYSLLVSESIVRNQQLSIGEYLPGHHRPTNRSSSMAYHLEPIGGRLYYAFPNAGSVLAIPFVVLLDGFGLSSVGAAGTYDHVGDLKAQAVIAAALMGGFAAVAFLIARLIADQASSVAVALVAAFGTQVWSTTSRVVWSDTWGILVLAFVAWAVLRFEVHGRAVNPFVLGTAVAWMYFVRPTNSVHAVLALGYLATLSFRRALAVSAVSIAWLAAFIVASYQIYGQPLPSYFRPDRLVGSKVAEAFAGNVISPSRGFLIGVPIAAFVFYVLVAYRKHLPALNVVPIAFLGCIAQFVPVMLFDHWWGGFSYGPRLTTGLLPWGVVLAAAAMTAWNTAHPVRKPFGERAAAVALAAASVFIHARGALASDTARWNYRPINIDLAPQRLWSWRHPQWLAGLVTAPEYLRFPPLRIGELVDFGAPENETYLGEGWSWPEIDLRWSEEAVAEVGFSLRRPEPAILRMMLQPGPSWRKTAGGLQVHVELNDRRLAIIAVSEPSPMIYAIGLPPNVLASRNTLRLRAPEAPPEVKGLLDARLLRVAAYWMRLDPYPLLADGQSIQFGGADADPFLGRGWGEGEGAYRWTLGSRAEIFFRTIGSGGRLWDLTLHPYLPPGDLGAQHVHLDVNGALSSALTLQSRDSRRYVVPLGADALQEFNVVGLTLPDARSPHSAGLGLDRRPLGAALHSATLRRFAPLAMGRSVEWGLPEAEPFLGNGWSAGEGRTRWNDGVTATIVFAAAPPADSATLVFDWEPFYLGEARPQRVRVTCNDVRLGELALDGSARRRTPVHITGAALRAENVVTLAFPIATSPAAARQSADERLLAVRIHSISIHPSSKPRGSPSGTDGPGS